MPTLTWQDQAGQTLSVVFDATLSEVHEDLVTLTDHPVERGVNITDHAKDEPSTLTVEGYVSNVPLARIAGVEASTLEMQAEFASDPGTQKIDLQIPSGPPTKSLGGLVKAGASALKKAATGGPKATAQGAIKFARRGIKARTLQYGSPRNRPKEIYDLLLDAKNQKALITVHTSIRDHEDLLIQRIAVPRTVQDGQSVRFQVDLRRILIANSETVSAPTPIEARGASKKNAGAQATTNKQGNSESEDAQLESSLHQIFF